MSRTTLNLDPILIQTAAKLTGITEKTALVHHGLRVLIQIEAGKRLAKMGGSMPRATAAPRRRPPRFENPG